MSSSPSASARPFEGVSDDPRTPTAAPTGSDPAIEIDLDAIQAAADRIRDQVVRTPCIRSPKLSTETGGEVYLKLETLQYTGSFKERGALNKLLSLSPEEQAAGVIAQSAGNHAQGVARHASRLGIPAVIVMPQFTPSVKVEQTRAFGAEVVLHGESLEETTARTEALIEERGLTLVHPYDDWAVIAGQGTMALEMLADVPDLDALIVPIGGGGMISGIAIAARALRPELAIWGVQTERFPAMWQAIHGEPIACGQLTIAEGIAVKRPGRRTRAVVEALVDEIALVSESAIEQAVRRLLQSEKLLTEGAGAAGVAALLDHVDTFEGQRVGIVICGGNIDPLILSSVIQRGLVHTQRLVRLRIGVRDVPGSLARMLQLVGEAGGNLVEVQHQRTFTTLPVQMTEVDITITTRGTDHVDEILETLRAASYDAALVSYR